MNLQEKINAVLEKFNLKAVALEEETALVEATTVGENPITISAESWDVGAQVFHIADGEQMPLPPGTYELEGATLTVEEEGVIASYEASEEPAEEMEEQPKEESKEESKDELQERFDAFAAELTTSVLTAVSEILEEHLSKEEPKNEQEEPKEELKEVKPAEVSLKKTPKVKTAPNANLQGWEKVLEFKNQLK